MGSLTWFCGNRKWVIPIYDRHPVGGVSLLHSQKNVPHRESMYPLGVDDIYLIYGWTTGPYWDCICPMDLYGHSASLDIPYKFVFYCIFFLCNVLFFFSLFSGYSFPCRSKVNSPFGFSMSFLLYLLLLFLRKLFLGLVLVVMDCPF